LELLLGQLRFGVVVRIEKLVNKIKKFVTWYISTNVKFLDIIQLPFISKTQDGVLDKNRTVEKLVAEAGDCSGTQRKGNVRRWRPLPSNGQ
jgi:hypothetical protein